MQTFRIEIFPREADGSATPFVQAAHQLGIQGLRACTTTRLFFLQGDIDAQQVEALAARLLTDPVTEGYHIGESAPDADAHLIETTLLPGVTDPPAENLVRAGHLLGMGGLQRAAVGHRYVLHGSLHDADLQRLALEVFSNPVIQRHRIDAPISAPFVPADPPDATVETIPLRALDDDALLAVSRERRLSLNIHEMRAIRNYFNEQGRDPSDAELEMLAQTWSEHCVHKTFKADVTYVGPPPGPDPHAEPTTQRISSLLKTYLRAATDALAKPWVHSAFVDNAGIVRFDDAWDLAFKVETHNRPSALEPFGGANTGVGGVIRDVLGVSARPIANTDMLFFGPPDLPHDALPDGVLHPLRIADGVVSGIEDYGNKMGIPTVNGAIYYDPGYTANPLVFCGCLGVLPHGSHRTEAQPDDLIVVIGGRTGRDGLRGATFSSMEMDSSTAQLSGGAVQIGHPIHEKQVQEVVLRARDEGLYNAITDCGAGGLSSAVGEMGAAIGATVQLEAIPLKYPGLRPWEVWLSEAQERMVLAIPPQHWARFAEICAGQDVEASVIGTYAPTGQMHISYQGETVGQISMDFLHDGIPTRQLEAVWTPPAFEPPHYPADEALADTLMGLLSSPVIRSKADVIHRYDHEVGTGTAVKPLVGARGTGPADAAVLVPLETLAADSDTPPAAAISNGLCPSYGVIDPYAMAWAAVDEALRNLTAVGADPDTVSILDNFSWGNTDLPDRMGALVRCVQGCHDAALSYGTPYISGKDSLNNEYLGADGQRHAIPGTLVISALGQVPDAARTVTSDLKTPYNLLYLVGETRDELGGSQYHALHGLRGGTVPQPNPNALSLMRALHQAIQAGWVRAAHDLSEGGLAVALAEMVIGGGLGARVALDPDAPLSDAALLFSESATRFVVEVSARDATDFEAALTGMRVQQIGTVSQAAALHVSRGEQVLIDLSAEALETAWRGTAAVTAERPAVPPTEIRRDTIETRTMAGRAMAPRVLILHANGTNRDRDAMLAVELAGGVPEIVHVNQLADGSRRLLDYHMLLIPGGFSYGDDLGAGVLWALDLRQRLGDVDRFIAEGRPVLGICNGFQTLVKAGLLPGEAWARGEEGEETFRAYADPASQRPVTLTHNERGQFECRWTYLKPNPHSPSLFTEGMTELIHCPVAHGEGRVAVRDKETLMRIWADGLAALTYVDEQGEAAPYPYNPNGSAYNIAALTNPAGNVLGLMPHPENHIYPWQHPRQHRGERGMSGLILFKNGIRYA